MKRLIKIFTIGICFGLVLLVIQKAFQINEEVFIHGYWVAAPAIVMGAVLINVLYNLSYRSKVQKIVRLLEEGKTQEYITGMEGLLKTAKGQSLRNLLELNLAAGYVEGKAFDRAIPMLEELSARRLNGSAAKAVHRINLCMSYFETGQYEKAIGLYNESQRIFEKYRRGKAYGAEIAIIDILVMMRQEQYEAAEKMLESAKKTYALQIPAFCELDQILNDVKNSQERMIR